MLNLITIPLFAAAAVAAVALPSPQDTTGNSGAQPYAIYTNITFYDSSSWPLHDTDDVTCYQPLHTQAIQANQCYNMSWPGVTVDRVPKGECVLQLYGNSATCHGESKTHSIAQGHGSSDCFVPLWAGSWVGSGIWTCG